jgi:tetratricopeptide (TPR) repeat protein
MTQGFYEYYGTGNAERALERFDAVLRSQPNNSDALGISGGILRRLRDWDEAIARTERAAELDPRNQVRVGSLAAAYTLVRRYREAGQVWDRMIAINPYNPTFYMRKARNYLVWEGNREQARRVLEQASNTVGIDPAWIMSFSRLLIRVLGEEYAEALDRLTLEEQSDTIYYYLAKAGLLRLGASAPGGSREQRRYRVRPLRRRPRPGLCRAGPQGPGDSDRSVGVGHGAGLPGCRKRCGSG